MLPSIPCLKKLYPAKEDLAEALKRHLAFFNTEGTLGGIIQGISIAMEEESASEKPLPGSAITSIKTGLMGPIAGMGDGIVWAVVMPIIYGVFIPYASQGSPLGGIAPLILWPGITIAIQYFITHRGYKLGRESITGILQSGVMQSIIYAANVLGLIMMGALSSSYISITTPFQITMGAGNTLVFQEILDAVVPGILPLVAVFAIYGYMMKKGPRYNVILISIVVISVVCALLGIL